MIHSTVGVYANGDFKTNGVAAKDLEDHVKYNLSYRPGRAFYLDGACLNRGYLTEAEAEEWRLKIIDMNLKPTHCTAPYH